LRAIGSSLSRSLKKPEPGNVGNQKDKRYNALILVPETGKKIKSAWSSISKRKSGERISWAWKSKLRSYGGSPT